MMKSLFPLVLALLATPVWSLSCLRPDIVRTFEQARDAEEGFWIVRGRVLSDQPIATPALGADGVYKDGAKADTPVRVVGQGLRPDGQFGDFVQDVTLSITCLAHWCGSVTLEEELFMAIEVKENGPELVADPCSNRIVRFSEEGEARLLRCVREGVCDWSVR